MRKRLAPEHAVFNDDDLIYYSNLEHDTKNNKNFRKVVSTTPNMQLVLMSLNPDTNLGPEIHPYTTQFVRVESGQGVVVIEGIEYELLDGDAIMIPLNTEHDIYNTSKVNHLKLYTIYSPPNHKYNKVEKDQYLA
jgi:mannose-6-phosphate isomerase-like protein (cupin superfamily)